jgi:hypothetical protein
MASILNADDGVVSGSAGLKSTADSSGVLALQTNGATAVTVTAAGSVGIGTSSPTTKLHIADNGDTALTIQSTTGSGQSPSIRLQRGTYGTDGFNDVRIYNTTGGLYVDNINSANEATNIFVGTPTGLGIGTSSPAYKLDLYSTVSQFTGRWGNATRAGHFYADSGGVGIFDTPSYGGDGMYFHAGSNYIQFITNGAENMRLNSSGNLGIGTTAPADSSSFGKALDLVGTNGAAYYARGTSGGSFAAFGQFNTAGGTTYIQNNGTGPILVYTNSGGGLTEQMRLTAAGSLVVGDTATSVTGERVSIRNNSGPNLILRSTGNPSMRFYSTSDSSSDSCQINYYSGTAFSIETIPALPMVFLTTNTERFRIAANGAFGLSGANYGSSGQVLTSQGSGSAPTWATAGGGSWTFLSTVTASNAATADVETTFSSTYDMYAIVVTGLTPGNTTDGWYSRLKVGGSYQTTNYSYNQLYLKADSTTVSSRATTNGGFIPIGYANDVNSFSSFVIYVPNPSSTSVKKTMYWTGFSQYSDLMNTFMGSGMYTGSNSALTGVRIYAAGGNLTGTFRLYGIKNS